MQKLNTCANLFFGFNKFEKFIEERIASALELNKLSEEDKVLYYKNATKLYFSDEERKSAWFKVIANGRKITIPDDDSKIKMIISLSALFISLYKEEIIEKTRDDSLNLLINKNAFTTSFGLLCEQKKGKPSIGNIEFDSYEDYFNFLRNKLLHGDFIIKDKMIIFKDKDKTGAVHFRGLINFCVNLYKLNKCKGKSFESSLILFSRKDIPRKDNKLLFSEIYNVDFKYSIKGKRQLLPETIDLIWEFEALVYEYNINKKYSLAKSIEIALKDKEKEFAECHLKVDFDISLAAKKEDKFFSSLDNMYDFFKRRYDIDKPSFSDIFKYLNLNLERDSKDIFNSGFGELYLFSINNMFFSSNAKSELQYEPLRFVDIDSSMNILKFYCYFHYGLDEVFSSGRNTKLKSILNGEMFDYSKLDLTLFDDPNMALDLDFDNYDAQKLKLTDDYNKLKDVYNIKKQNYVNFINKYGNTKPDVELRLKNALETSKKAYKEALELVEKEKEFSKEKYIKNLNIINHIRNAIAHGNYEYDCSNVEDKRYIFKDIYNGKINYQLNIKEDDFKSLFNSINLLEEYFNNLINEDCNITYRRLQEEEKYIDCIFVDEKKKSIWNQYVDSVIKSGDDIQKKVLEGTYYVLGELMDPTGIFNTEDEVYDCSYKFRNNLLSVAHLAKEDFKNVKINNTRFTYDEFKMLLKNTLIYETNFNKFIGERRLDEGKENSMIREVLAELGYQGCLRHSYKH